MRFPAFGSLLILLCLTACGGEAVTSTRFSPATTPGEQLCINQCMEARRYCRENCTVLQRQCTIQMQNQAIIDYEVYARDQFNEHKNPELRPRDFERLQTCAPELCRNGCDERYKSCYEECGGQVVTTTSCQFLCF